MRGAVFDPALKYELRAAAEREKKKYESRKKMRSFFKGKVKVERGH